MDATWQLRRLLLLAEERRARTSGRQRAGQEGRRPEAEESEEPLEALLNRSMTAQFQAASLSELARAVSLGAEFQLDLLLTGVREVPAALIPYERLRVLLAAPEADELADTWRAWQILRCQGIATGILSGRLPLPTALALSRPYAKRLALPESEVVAAFTSSAAAVAGVAPLGRLAEGSSADFLVVSARLFDLDARIEHVFIEGREVYDRSRAR